METTTSTRKDRLRIAGAWLVEESTDRLLMESPAKINLHLEVLGKRADGFHELETLLATIDLCDRIELRRTKQSTEVAIDDATVDATDNLVTRAVRLVREESGRDDGVAIAVKKKIPIGAGLGGGSSNAAATLAGLDRLWNLNWPIERLGELGAKLGSDVPFFFHAPAAIARGRGERLEPCRLKNGFAFDLVLVCPQVGLSTASVFRNTKLSDEKHSIAGIVAALEAGDVPAIGGLLFNRLEEASARLCPEVERIRQAAATWNCLGHRMTGSGSSYFAVCASAIEARALADRVAGQGLGRVHALQGGL